MELIVIPRGFYADNAGGKSFKHYSAPLIADRLLLLEEYFDNVTFIAGCEGGNYEREYTENGSVYIKIPTNGRISLMKYMYLSVKELLHKKGEDDEVVVLNFNPHIPGCVIGSVCELLNIKLATYFIGLPEQDKGTLQKHIFTHRLLLELSDVRICLTPVFRDRLQEIADVPITIVPNAVHSMFKPMANIKRDKNIILYVGRFAEEKQLPMLVNAFSKVLDRNPNSQLMLIGAREAERANQIRDLATDLGVNTHLHIKKRIPRKEIPEWMNRARTLVLPSRDEGFGMVLLEAMACGTPPIGMNSGSVPWVIDDAGLICDNKQELSNNIERMMQNDELFQQLHSRSLDRVKKFKRDQWGENIRDAIMKNTSNN